MLRALGAIGTLSDIHWLNRSVQGQCLIRPEATKVIELEMETQKSGNSAWKWHLYRPSYLHKQSEEVVPWA